MTYCVARTVLGVYNGFMVERHGEATFYAQLFSLVFGRMVYRSVTLVLTESFWTAGSYGKTYQ